MKALAPDKRCRKAHGRRRATALRSVLRLGGLSFALALLAGCSPPVPPATAVNPATAEPTGPIPSARPSGWHAVEGPSAASPAPAPLRWTLQAVGELERADGRVERSYRVTLHNGAQPQQGLLAEVSPRAAELQVLQGTLVLGDVPGGQHRSAPRSLIVLQAPDRALQADDLVWKLSADAALHDSSGALLPGAPDEAAAQGLRAWEPALPSGWRVEAVVQPQARVADVNQALVQQQWRIARMRPGNHTLLLHPTRSQTAAELQRGAQALVASGAFLHTRVLAGPAVAHTAPASAIPTDGEAPVDPFIPCLD